ncbi:MAG: TMEM43 family protein [Bacilli bacterium]|nr:TMEM43 family protein [Bacilli bacterium]
MKKIGDSFKGIIGGFVLIAVAVVLLWWNEGNNVRNLKTTAEMGKNYIDVSSEKVNSENEGKLVATSGKLINEEELTDTKFNVKVTTPLLKRTVEVYQWEEEKETDSSDNTTYNYKKVWSSSLIDSSDFHNGGHTNPTTKLYEDETYTSTDVKVGAFSLSNEQVLTLSTKGTVSTFDTDFVKELGFTAYGNYLTNAEDINNPKIGDYRIIFEYNNSSEVSVLAVQKGNSFVDYVSSADKTINRVMDGVLSGEEMINVIKKENKILKWILRAVGIILCAAGFGAILKPISTIAGYVPILGSIVGAAVGLVSFLLGLAVSLVVIAIAWIRFRPVLGICLLAAVVAIIVLLITKFKNKKQETPVTPVENANTPVQETPSVNESEVQNTDSQDNNI